MVDPPNRIRTRNEKPDCSSRPEISVLETQSPSLNRILGCQLQEKVRRDDRRLLRGSHVQIWGGLPQLDSCLGKLDEPYRTRCLESPPPRRLNRRNPSILPLAPRLPSFGASCRSPLLGRFGASTVAPGGNRPLALATRSRSIVRGAGRGSRGRGEAPLLRGVRGKAPPMKFARPIQWVSA